MSAALAAPPGVHAIAGAQFIPRTGIVRGMSAVAGLSAAGVNRSVLVDEG